MSPSVPVAAAQRRRKVPASVVAMLIFVGAEVMFFSALISAHQIYSAGASAWPPPDQPRLPVATTAANTAILLLSGLLVFLANRGKQARLLLVLGVACGVVFVAVQGVEWVRLIGFGLTLRSSAYGSFFYLIVGAHATHALAALIVWAWALPQFLNGSLTRDAFLGAQVFWYFVVGLWPILYGVVYLT